VAPSAAVRRSVPVRAISGWLPVPGFVEADLVARTVPHASHHVVHQQLPEIQHADN